MKDTLVQIYDEATKTIQDYRQKRVEGTESLKTVKSEMKDTLRKAAESRRLF